MLLIAYAYKELNAVDPDCGTTFTWATRAFGPRSAGWAAGASSPPTCRHVEPRPDRRQLRFQLVGRPGGRKHALDHSGRCRLHRRDDRDLLHRHRGLRSAAVRLLASRWSCWSVLSVVALVKAYAQPRPVRRPIHLAAGLVQPLPGTYGQSLTPGVLAAVFIYWGWDTASRSTRRQRTRRTPPAGRPSSRPSFCSPSTHWSPPPCWPSPGPATSDGQQRRHLRRARQCGASAQLGRRSC